MSALTYLMQNQDFEAVLENVFVDSCVDLIKRLDETGLASIDEYIGLLEDKKVKKSLEMEISEALIPILENNAALYGTFLFEGDDVELTKEEAKIFLESVRGHFGREFIIEALSEKVKQRLKTAGKVGAGLAAAGAVGAGLYKAAKGEDGKLSVDNLKDTGKKVADKAKNLVSGDKDNRGSWEKKAADKAKQAVADNDPGSRTNAAAPETTISKLLNRGKSALSRG
jgi:polyhydroxyalkanoate synthesis regulator phasin